MIFKGRMWGKRKHHTRSNSNFHKICTRYEHGKNIDVQKPSQPSEKTIYFSNPKNEITGSKSRFLWVATYE